MMMRMKMNKFRFRFRVKKIELKSLAQMLDNCTVCNGIMNSPQYGYALQRKRRGWLGFFTGWEHVFWTKKDYSHLNFLIDNV